MSPLLWAAGGGPIVSVYINSPVKSNFFSVQEKYAGFRVNRIWTSGRETFFGNAVCSGMAFYLVLRQKPPFEGVIDAVRIFSILHILMV
jgi:hypothetical protein